MPERVNFKELRAKLDFEQVLRHYGVEVKRRGNQHHGFCPLPDHNGKKNSPSFSAQLEKGIFHCFGCGAKGNQLDFAAMMAKVNVNDGAALRTVALELQKRFCPELGNVSKPKEKTAKQPEAKSENKLPKIVNAPLGFELKDLDVEHPYLKNRGFTSETINQFGLGFCSRGMLKDRIAIPLHDHTGQLVGYAGRVVDDSTITEDNPRYRFPGERKREGKILEFQKTLFLYNGFRIKAPVENLIVVEGFPSVWWLTQMHLPHCVALMGWSCSDEQAQIITEIVSPSGYVWLVTDGDDAGERCAQSALPKVALHRFTRLLKLDEGKQPTDYPAAFFRQRLK